MCKELGLGYAQSGLQTHIFNGNSTENEVLSGISCNGREDFLSECRHDKTNFCPGPNQKEFAAVICQTVQADLSLDLYALMSSVYLEDKYIFYLQVRLERASVDQF